MQCSMDHRSVESQTIAPLRLVIIVWAALLQGLRPVNREPRENVNTL
jgi:hypothetical protein